MYEKVIKRLLDFLLSLLSLVVLSPLFLVLILSGAVAMRGNPFFIQKRPGRISKDTGDERIISIVKFRTMTNSKDEQGNYLPDEERLTPYGKFLRSTSLDELPSLWNIVKGDLAICGPRPLLIEYLPWYTEEERRRHTVRPGLTGWAQIHGRNSVKWDVRFQMDVEYVDHISFLFDVKIILLTVKMVLKREGVAMSTEQRETNMAKERQSKLGARP